MSAAPRAGLPPLPPFDSLKPPPAQTPAIAALQSLIGTLFAVTVSHTSRQFLGTFVCLDPQGNIVLDAALEFELDAETGAIKGDPAGREVGLVMIPRKWWTRVERVKTDEERHRDALAAQQEAQGCTPS
ncbi:uncharacterized protein JCM10292_001565 [Rhodotorula paludigena]|uniref:uncharacterized protein n=1 Tax=Rhodotorula paludigena TaxID=86838 RepID=UPI0031700FE8